jgi:hypothetical protein
MNYEQAILKAQQEAREHGIDPDKIDTERQRKKFYRGYGIVRKLAGLSFGKNSK